MKNKVLIKLIVPSLMEEYELFIPVNERIARVKELIINSLSELTDNKIDKQKIYFLLDPDTGQAYDNKSVVRDLKIHNLKKILFI